ncbi:MAG: hypothetical protein AB4426_17155 [Xenococcaceae cyanobacterium]
MNALQPLEPLKSPRVTPRRHRHRRHYSHMAVAAEITVKLLVNGVLSAAAIIALAKLLPYHLSQQAKLREVRIEVKDTETRVNQLRENFNRNFDPSQTKIVMQEQSPWVDPNQRRVVLLDPKQ